MKIALCATHLEKMILPQDREYIGVDHGVEELLKQGITPKFAIGDFDSLQNRQIIRKFKYSNFTRKKRCDRYSCCYRICNYLKVMMKLNYMVLPEDV